MQCLGQPPSKSEFSSCELKTVERWFPARENFWSVSKDSFAEREFLGLEKLKAPKRNPQGTMGYDCYGLATVIGCWSANGMTQLTSTKALTLSLPRVINFKFLFQSLTRDISYSMENLAIDSLLRWKLIEQSFLTTSLNHFLLEWLGEFALWAWDWKGYLSKVLLTQHLADAASFPGNLALEPLYFLAITLTEISVGNHQFRMIVQCNWSKGIRNTSSTPNLGDGFPFGRLSNSCFICR